MLETIQMVWCDVRLWAGLQLTSQDRLHFSNLRPKTVLLRVRSFILLVLVVAHFCKLTKQYVGGVSGCGLGCSWYHRTVSTSAISVLKQSLNRARSFMLLVRYYLTFISYTKRHYLCGVRWRQDVSRAAADTQDWSLFGIFVLLIWMKKCFFLSCWFMGKVDILFSLVYADGPMFWFDQW